MLDLFGPLACIFEFAEGAKASEQLVDPHELTVPHTQGRDRTLPSMCPSVSQQHFLGREKRGPDESAYKPAPSQQVCAILPFQDGRYTSPAGHPPSKGLDGEAGPEGRLPDESNCHLLPRIPVFPVERLGLAFHMSTICSVIISVVLHQATRPGNALTSCQRRAVDRIPR